MNRPAPLAAAALTVAAAWLTACAARQAAPALPAASSPPAPPASSPAPARPGIDPTLVKAAVDPCTDFYEYACGGWLERTRIPADRSRWTRSFDVMREENQLRLRAILDAQAAGQLDPQDPWAGLTGSFYGACMDVDQAEARGLADLQAAWRQVDGVQDARTLSAAVGRLHAENAGALFDLSSDQDAKDSTQVIAQLTQGGLSLPDRDYYLKADEPSATLRKDFEAHVARQLAAAGVPARQAAADARDILALETALAGSHWTRTELRDPNRVYNRLDLAGVKRIAPRFDWAGYLAALGAPGLTAINVSTPRTLEAIDALLATTPAATWRAYLRWHLLAEAAEARALPRALSDEAFWFRARHFTGETAMPERWKHCVDLTDRLLGFALGRSFVRATFGGDAKAQALSLVRGIQGAMRQRLAGLAWMDAPTRARAIEKLAAIDNKIAFPDAWRSYAGLVVRRDAFSASLAAAGAFEMRRQLAKIGQPVDRTEWGMTPPTVNAYYNPAMNEMVFPAGILMPPFYTQGANDAVNYGAIGLVVGHELTHGFDDEGRKFDARGNLTDWWTKAVSDEFDRRAACVERQYSAFIAIGDVKVNGQLTLGENLADLGGLTLAFQAYQASRAGKPPEAPVAGFTPPQQFFLAHAQAWCQLIRDENARLRAVTDPHSPARWRVNGPLSNLPAFAEAFQCRPGSAMVRAERCDVW